MSRRRPAGAVGGKPAHRGTPGVGGPEEDSREERELPLGNDLVSRLDLTQRERVMPKRNRKPVGCARAALVAALLLTHVAIAAADDVDSSGTVRIEPDVPTAGAPAAAGWTAFQASLWPPIQIFDSNRKVNGLRINFPYGSQTRVSGLDFGLANRVTAEMRGAQLGIANFNDGTTAGAQLGLSNSSSLGLRGAQLGFLNLAYDGPVRGVQLGFGNTSAGLTGLQLGVVNLNYGDSRGAQLGLFNTTGAHKGFQLGLFNGAKSLRGLQLGLVNRVVEGPLPSYLPLFNAGW